MICLNVLCESVEEMHELRDRICRALYGSAAFREGGIAVEDFPGLDRAFEIFIGKPNNHNIEYDMRSDNFCVRYDADEDK